MRLARALGWTVHEVKAMSGYEFRAALDQLQGEDLARKRAEAKARSRGRR